MWGTRKHSGSRRRVDGISEPGSRRWHPPRLPSFIPTLTHSPRAPRLDRCRTGLGQTALLPRHGASLGPPGWAGMWVQRGPCPLAPGPAPAVSGDPRCGTGLACSWGTAPAERLQESGRREETGCHCSSSHCHLGRTPPHLRPPGPLESGKWRGGGPRGGGRDGGGCLRGTVPPPWPGGRSCLGPGWWAGPVQLCCPPGASPGAGDRSRSRPGAWGVGHPAPRPHTASTGCPAAHRAPASPRPHGAASLHRP